MKLQRIAILICLLSSACTQGKPDAFELFDNGMEISAEKPDLIYLVSTNVMSAEGPDGEPAYIAELNETDRKYYDKEFAYVDSHISQGDFNLIAPYYHQFTFSGTGLPKEQFDSVYQEVAAEVCAFFDWYMSEVNNGRDFVLAGFSQGAMLLRDIMMNMDDRTFSHMAAAYMIGYRLSDDDLQDPHINAATGSSDTQVAISFNSVASEDGIWELVSDGAATCINPVNWRTDSTPALFNYDGDEGSVYVNVERQVLMVDINPEKYCKWMKQSPLFSGIHPDNRHHWDLMFYSGNIHDNALTRVQNLHR